MTIAVVICKKEKNDDEQIIITSWWHKNKRKEQMVHGVRDTCVFIYDYTFFSGPTNKNTSQIQSERIQRMERIQRKYNNKLNDNK